jgi:2-keto-4-pentenoate hydratase/2-oxohepta-3-ene-1,7-dioic acid hydratase in catechol pathway
MASFELILGVGYAMENPQFLKPGDNVEIYVEKVGTLQHGIE